MRGDPRQHSTQELSKADDEDLCQKEARVAASALNDSVRNRTSRAPGYTLRLRDKALETGVPMKMGQSDEDG
jgi:hypothetical protein